MVVETQPTPPSDLVIPETLPVLPLRETVVFPLAVMPVGVGQERSVRLVDAVMNDKRLLVLAGYKSESPQPPGPEGIPRVATVAVIHQLQRAPNGTLQLIVQGLERVRILDFVATEPYLIGRIEPAPDRSSPGLVEAGVQRAVVDLFRRLVSLIDGLPDEIGNFAEGLTDPRQVAYLVAATIPLDTAVRQELLELDPVDAKLRRLVELLQHEVAVRELGRKIASETEERLSKQQREYVLREQLRSIQRELGEEEHTVQAELRERIEKARLPELARQEAERELGRLGSIPPASPEYGIIQTYLDWMASLPWNTLSGGAIDVQKTREVLDQDHYDLEKIKVRILEYLAVKKLREDRERQRPLEAGGETPEQPIGLTSREPILCFVGPPGVGKTSLGHSIARALGREFVRMSLGGVHDEAEIRGHRRTYIGAMPGRIIQGIKRAGTRDPVFTLDEIDKVGADWRGDPSSALLEVLDPAQNNAFVDNYLGVPFDLSQVLFIATANTLDTIPEPLRDRMEILQLAGYTEEEKLGIATRYLIPKQIAANGLRRDELVFQPEAVREIIRGYTREAGVRNLEREIGAICRKVAREVAEGRSEPVTLDAELVSYYLERPRFYDELAERIDRPGVATGLAWTPVGGDVLFVEATMVPSREERLILTGMLGDVMRESAQAALSYVRSMAGPLGIDPAAFDGKTIHIHVPAGAIPKDGPSAGVTMVTALVSVATGRPVRRDLAMTGEITLRGKVLPVGGIKEKVLAAHRIGIRTVILPKRNERDVEDVPAELRKQMTFIFVDTIDDVIEHGLTPAEEAQGSPDGGRAKAGGRVRART